MNTGQQLKKAQIRQLPKNIANHIFNLQGRYRTRMCKLYIKSPGWQLYLSEGCKYYGWRNGQEFSMQMQSQSSLHAGGPTQSHQIGRRIEVPQGSWVVEFELFCGKPIINVHHVGAFQIS